MAMVHEDPDSDRRPVLDLPLAPPLFAREVSQQWRELLTLHLELIAAHVNGDVDRWRAIESVDNVTANQGRVTFSDREERRNARAFYLEGTEFEVYRDLRDPMVNRSPSTTSGRGSSSTSAPRRAGDWWATSRTGDRAKGMGLGYDPVVSGSPAAAGGEGADQEGGV